VTGNKWLTAATMYS